jgi:hypothetical protein
MNILAYTYEADTHCIDCTQVRYHGSELEDTDINGIGFEQADSEGNLVHALFSYDEWQEYDPAYLAENPTQYLACGNCHEVIDSYTHEG